MTKPIIVVKMPCKLLYVIQVKGFLIKCSTSWPYLISEFLVAYITIVASDWPRTFFTPKVFLFSIYPTASHHTIWLTTFLMQAIRYFQYPPPHQISSYPTNYSQSINTILMMYSKCIQTGFFIKFY